MKCSRCEKDPTFHSFQFVYRKPAGEAIFYTCPSKSKLQEMKEKDILDFVAHMDEASVSAWEWVFDCSGLQSYQMPSLTVLQAFIQVIQERYKFVLKSIYILNINWKMHMILSMVKPFIRDDVKRKLIILESKLDILANGFDIKMIQSVQ